MLCEAKKKRSEEKTIYLLKRLTGHTNEKIGKRFGMSYSGVSKVAGSVEKQMLENKQKKQEMESIISSFKV
ncbi:MAG: hypothetical protein Q8Q33_08520 [Chlamydiota bacterium]|nr:hypothetical protein [Chlamydiota bacterium]